MKIQIDTQAKTIRLEQGANLSDLFDFLENIFPNGEWGEYTLEANTVIQSWGNPIVIEKHVLQPVYHGPYWWEHMPLTVTCESSSGQMVIDMSKEPPPDVCTSGYAQAAGDFLDPDFWLSEQSPAMSGKVGEGATHTINFTVN